MAESRRPVSAVPCREDQVLRSLRRIIQAVDLYSRRLISEHGITGPQLVCLRQLAEAGPLSAGDLARSVSLRPATMSGILDRLEGQGLIQRVRQAEDRRRMQVSLTAAGRAVLRSAPPSLHDDFIARFRGLPRAEQVQIEEVLGKLVHMMSAESLEAAPLLVPGTVLNRNGSRGPGTARRTQRKMD